MSKDFKPYEEPISRELIQQWIQDYQCRDPYEFVIPLKLQADSACRFKISELRDENERLKQEVERLEQANKELDYAYYMLYERGTGHNYGLYCEIEKLKENYQKAIEAFEDVLEGVARLGSGYLEFEFYIKAKQILKELAEAEQVGEVQE